MSRKMEQRRVRIATLLLVALIPVFFVKTFHHHDPIHLQKCLECDVYHHHIHKTHLSEADTDSWANCVICHFSFSPSEEATFYHVRFEKDFDNVYPIVAILSVKQNFIYYYSLRAPPSNII